VTVSNNGIGTGMGIQETPTCKNNENLIKIAE
jgi:hypothetical protein